MYIFQLGRDGDISTLEIIRVLESITGELPEIMRYDKFVLIKDEFELDTKNLASTLAATLKIAKVFHVSKEVDKSFINSLEFYFPKNFEIYVTSDNEELGQSAVELLNEFKKENKSRGSVLISNDTKIKPFAGEFEKVKDDICEIILLKNNDEYFFAQVEAYTDPNEFKFKDEARPVQKFTHGTSPRVAKMMVNILSLEPGKTMVGPFCGIGTFLVEGMIAGLKVIGIDNDKPIVSSAQNNVAWARKQFNLNGPCQIICSDSTHEIFRADGCVFEPYMGPFMKKLPSLFEATKVKTYYYCYHCCN